MNSKDWSILRFQKNEFTLGGLLPVDDAVVIPAPCLETGIMPRRNMSYDMYLAEQQTRRHTSL